MKQRNGDSAGQRPTGRLGQARASIYTHLRPSKTQHRVNFGAVAQDLQTPRRMGGLGVRPSALMSTRDVSKMRREMESDDEEGDEGNSTYSGDESTNRVERRRFSLVPARGTASRSEVEELVNRAQRQVGAFNFERAAATITEAIWLDPRFPDLYIMRAECLRHIKAEVFARHDEAFADRLNASQDISLKDSPRGILLSNVSPVRALSGLCKASESKSGTGHSDGDRPRFDSDQGVDLDPHSHSRAVLEGFFHAVSMGDLKAASRIAGLTPTVPIQATILSPSIPTGAHAVADPIDVDDMIFSIEKELSDQALEANGGGDDINSAGEVSLWNAQDSYGWTALHYAAAYAGPFINQSRMSMCECIFAKYGAITGLWDDAHWAPVALAAFVGNQAALKWFMLPSNISSGITAVGSKTVHGLSLLHAAVLGLHEDSLQHVISASAEKDSELDINSQDAEGNSSLHLAAHIDHHTACSALINAGALVNIMNNAGETPLAVALRSNASHATIGVLKRGLSSERSGWKKKVIRGATKNPAGTRLIKRFARLGRAVRKSSLGGSSTLSAAKQRALMNLGGDALREGYTLVEGSRGAATKSVLGTGRASVVLFVRRRGVIWAMKRVWLNDCLGDPYRSVQKWYGISPHPNLLRVDGGYPFIDQNGSVLCIVMAYYPYTLRDLVMGARRGGRLIAQNRVMSWFRQLLEALAHVHSHRDSEGNYTVHRNIKLSNVLVTKDRRSVLLGDLGLDFSIAATQTRKAQMYFANMAESVVYDFHYMAPELLGVSASKSFTHANDIWALGLVFLEIVTSTSLVEKPTPFAMGALRDANFTIGKLDEQRVEAAFGGIVCDIIIEMTKVNPAKRPSARHLLEKYFSHRQHRLDEHSFEDAAQRLSGRL